MTRRRPLRRRLGQRIRTLRKGRGLTQGQLAAEQNDLIARLNDHLLTLNGHQLRLAAHLLTPIGELDLSRPEPERAPNESDGST